MQRNNMGKTNTVKHPIPPIYDKYSRVLILGTMPSPISREKGFYYAHPQNRFWKVLGQVFGETIPDSNVEKKDFLLKHHIAMWDILKSCEIRGASDASIINPIPNDILNIMKNTEIQTIFTTGKKAEKLFRTFFKDLNVKLIPLPSTSAANAVMSFEMLTEAYKNIRKILEE